MKNFNGLIFIFLFLMILSGCNSLKEDHIKLVQSKNGMSFHGLKEDQALKLVGLLEATFPELEKVKIVSVKFDESKNAYFIIPEHYMPVTPQVSAELRKSYLISKDLTWIEYRNSGEPNVKRKISSN